MEKISWNDLKVEQGIKKVMGKLDINRMPSASETREVNGDYTLSNAISRSGGFESWAERLELEMKVSETSLGRKYEEIIANRLREMGFEIKIMTTKHPYDLLVNDKVKVDVKSSNLYNSNGAGKWHTFNLEKEYPTCDIYIAVALVGGEIDRIFIIPSKYLHITQLSVGKESVYNKFINQWNYIGQYDKFYNSIE